MRAVGLAAMLCGFGAGLVTFPILVVHLDWRGGLVTLSGVTLCIVGGLLAAWFMMTSSTTRQPPHG
jgi:hypothetical protein